MTFKCKTVKTNFHMHTTFADGKNTVEEMILAAIDNGGEAVGFSEHGYTPIDHSWCMLPEATDRYIENVNLYKEKYKDKIKVYCGIEADYYTVYDKTKFDYSIGSVHYVEKDGFYIPVDKSARDTDECTQRLYGGDYLALAKDYFLLVGDVLEKTGADIVGHLDVLYKFNEKNPRFDEEGKDFIKAATDAIDNLIPYGKPFEINTGAISRSYKTKPYPSAGLIDYIGAMRGKVIMSSDSHNADTVYFGLDDAYEMLVERKFPKENILFYPF